MTIRDEEIFNYANQIKFCVAKGNDGKYYAVFTDQEDLLVFDAVFSHYFNDCRICNFGNFSNAFELGVLQ